MRAALMISAMLGLSGGLGALAAEPAAVISDPFSEPVLVDKAPAFAQTTSLSRRQLKLFLTDRTVNASWLARALDRVSARRLENRHRSASEAAAALDQWAMLPGFPEAAESQIAAWLGASDAKLILRGLKAAIYLKPSSTKILARLCELLTAAPIERRPEALLAVKEISLEHRVAPDTGLVSAFVAILGARDLSLAETLSSPRNPAAESPTNALKHELIGTLLLFQHYARHDSPLFTKEFSMSAADRERLALALSSGLGVGDESDSVTMDTLRLLREYHPRDRKVATRIARLTQSRNETIRRAAAETLGTLGSTDSDSIEALQRLVRTGAGGGEVQAAREALQKIQGARPWWHWWN